MTKKEDVKKLVLLAILVSGIVTYLSATYYKPEFFPIGLTGLNYTGSGTPYGGQGWKWQVENPGDKTEDSLIFSLGVNCLGCQDAKPDYLIDLNPESTSTWTNNYLHKICKNAPANNPVYIITAGYYVEYPKYSLVFADTFWDSSKTPPVIDSIRDSVSCDEASYDTFREGPWWGNHPSGVYFIQIQESNISTNTERFVLIH